MTKEMTQEQWVEWMKTNRAEIRTKHPDWNAYQVSTYLQGMADIFEGQGLIQRPQRGWL